jgi:hypothetical protein
VPTKTLADPSSIATGQPTGPAQQQAIVESEQN